MPAATIFQLEEEKKAISSIDEIVSYLNDATSYNYYTGAYNSSYYDNNNELSRIVENTVSDDEYKQYLIAAAEKQGDIFIISQKFEKTSIASEYVIEHYDNIINIEKFNNIVVIEDIESYLADFFEIPDRLLYFINFEHLLHEYCLIDNSAVKFKGVLIIDENYL